MKNSTSMLLGVAAALAVSWLASAASPAVPPDLPRQLKVGGTIFGFDVLSGGGKGLSSLSPDSPVTIREVRGGWFLVDYPTQKTGPVWVNSDMIVSFRTNH
jgi:hypothetical protein